MLTKNQKRFNLEQTKKAYIIMYEKKDKEILANRGACRQAFEDSDEAMIQAQKLNKKDQEFRHWAEEIIIYPPLEQK